MVTTIELNGSNVWKLSFDCQASARNPIGNVLGGSFDFDNNSAVHKNLDWSHKIIKLVMIYLFREQQGEKL